MSQFVLKNVDTPFGLRRVAHGIAVPGPQGIPGTAGGGYVHTQGSPATTWTVNHNLGYRPAVEVLDTGGNEVIASVQHISVNQFLVQVQPAMAGTARAT